MDVFPLKKIEIGGYNFRKNLPPALVVGEIGLVRSLGQAGIPVIVGTHYTDNIGLYSRYCHDRIHFSHPSSDKFADELVEFGRLRKQKHVFFSDDDRAVLTFSRNRSRLSEYYYFNLPDPMTVEDVIDKHRFAKLAQALNIPAPKSLSPETMEEFLVAANEITYPCILKPTNKDYWWHPDFLRIVGPYRKAIRCEQQNELVDLYKKVVQINKNVIVQEYISGNDSDQYSVNMYLNKQQSMLAYFLGHKIRIYPIHGGIGTLVETMENGNIRCLAIDIARKLKFTGSINIQFKKIPDTGDLKVIEINPRHSVWCYLATGAGLNISAIAYYDMIGISCPLNNNYRTGVKWLDISKDVKAARAYHKAGELKYRAWLQSLQGKLVHHIISWKDPLPMVIDAWLILKRRILRRLVSGAAPPA